MEIIGERINGTRKSIARAIKDRDHALISREAVAQKEAGAHYLDLNAGTGAGNEAENLSWLVSVVQDAGCVDLCLDSSTPSVLGACLGLVKGNVLLNSINGEERKLDEMLPLLDGYRGGVIVLPMDDKGIPADVEGRLRITEKIVSRVTARGNKVENIYVDPLVQPVATDPDNGRIFLESVSVVKKSIPGIRVTCGLSNVSFGLPGRKVLNRCFMSLAIAAGVDSALIDPVDSRMLTAIFAAEALTGRDQYCMNYINAFRSGRMEEK